MEQAFKLRYAGLGFIWAWIYGSYETSAVYPNRGGTGINADPTWVLSATAVVITLLVGGLALGRHYPRNPAKWGFVAAILTLAGTVLTALPLSDGSLSLLGCGGGIASGIGSGILIILWGSALTQLKMDQVEMAVPSSSVIMLACALVLPYLPISVGIAATASLPLIAAFMLASTFHEIQIRPEAGPKDDLPPLGQRDARGPARASLRIALILFVSYGVMGCAGVLRSGPDSVFALFGLDLPVMLGAIFGIALMVLFVLFSAHMNFDSLFRWVAPLLAVFLALMPWADLRCVFLSETIVSISDTALQIALVLFAVKIAKRAVLTAPAAIGLLQGALQLGVLVGNATGLSLQTWATSTPHALFMVALMLSCVLALCWLAFPVDRESHPATMALPSPVAPTSMNAMGVLSSPDYANSSPATGRNTALPARESQLEETCLRLAQDRGLSARETEILGYLARGRSQPYIREELVLSKNTVASHVKHIYQKLNVHSRQELIDLFESADPPSGA